MGKKGDFLGISVEKACSGILGVQNGPQNGNHKVCKMFSPLVELEPTHDAMLGQVFAYARFSNAQMVRKQRFDVDASPPVSGAARHIANCDAKRFASFDVIVGGHVVVGENEDTWAGWSAIRLIEFYGRACE